MYINLTDNELYILQSAMEYAIEQYADNGGDVDPCYLNDMRCFDQHQYAENLSLMDKTLFDLKEAIAKAEEARRKEEAKEVEEDLFFGDAEQQYVIEINNATIQETMQMTCDKATAQAVCSALDQVLRGNDGFDYHTYWKVHTVRTLDEFLDKCTAHGSNWTAMFLSGIKAIDPWFFERMPEIDYEFDEVCWIAKHLIEEHQELNCKYDISYVGKRIWMWDCDTPVWRLLTDEEQNMPFKELFCRLNKMSEAEYEAYTK